MALYDKLDSASFEAEKTHGRRPIGLISWRNYTIGDGEIELRRDNLLEEGQLDPDLVEKEYLDARARYEAQLKGASAWDKRTGLSKLRKEFDRSVKAARVFEKRLAEMKPTSVAGAAALLQYLLEDDLETGGDYWHLTALKSLASSLCVMSGGQR
jgi:hypothetical protein